MSKQRGIPIASFSPEQAEQAKRYHAWKSDPKNKHYISSSPHISFAFYDGIVAEADSIADVIALSNKLGYRDSYIITKRKSSFRTTYDMAADSDVLRLPVKLDFCATRGASTQFEYQTQMVFDTGADVTVIPWALLAGWINALELLPQPGLTLMANVRAVEFSSSSSSSGSDSATSEEQEEEAGPTDAKSEASLMQGTVWISIGEDKSTRPIPFEADQDHPPYLQRLIGVKDCIDSMVFNWTGAKSGAAVDGVGNLDIMSMP